MKLTSTVSEAANTMTNDISNIISQIILILLALSTLIGILDFVGFLPSKVRDFLKLNRSSDTISTLRELGIDVKAYKSHNKVLRFPQDIRAESIQFVAQKALEKFRIDSAMSMGTTAQLGSHITTI